MKTVDLKNNYASEKYEKKQVRPESYREKMAGLLGKTGGV